MKITVDGTISIDREEFEASGRDLEVALREEPHALGLDMLREALRKVEVGEWTE